MWEADFLGDRSSPDFYGNSRWGELNGLRSSNSGTNYSEMNTNFAYGLFCNTIKLWNLYMDDDRTKLEKNLSVITDKRQLWSMPPYHYNGTGEGAWLYPYGGDPSDTGKLIAGIDKTPYYTSGAAIKDRNSQIRRKRTILAADIAENSVARFNMKDARTSRVSGAVSMYHGFVTQMCC